MNEEAAALMKIYANALREFLDHKGEEPLAQAYEIGRTAISKGMGLLQMAELHQLALVGALLHTQTPEESAEVAKRAADFFSESLSPFEMHQRGFREAILALRQLNETLEERVKERTAELQQAHDELELRVAERTSELSQANTNLAFANRELEAFSYSVSHDLRSPLRAILGFSKILLEECGDTMASEFKGHLRQISTSAQRMAHLIDDLLAFSRLSRQGIKKIPVDMNNLLQEVLLELKPEQPHHHLDISIAPLSLVEADAALLKQVWLNLVSNALKYSSRNSSAMIQIGCQEQLEEIVFFIKDNGVGFDMRFAAKLFGVFQRLHSTKEFEGTGVGLANVKRIINRHGGKVWAESKPHEGASFYFTLPRSHADDSEC